MISRISWGAACLLNHSLIQIAASPWYIASSPVASHVHLDLALLSQTHVSIRRIFRDDNIVCMPGSSEMSDALMYQPSCSPFRPQALEPSALVTCW